MCYYIPSLQCSEFNSSAVDAFNCQNVQIEHSLFHNNSAMLEKDQYRANSGGLSIAYHTNKTIYFNMLKSASVQVTDCVFSANSAYLTEANTRQQIDQALNNHTYFGRGGGLGIFLDEYFINIMVDISQCTFDDNFAESFGGGLYIYIDGNMTLHTFTVSESNFTSNRVGGSGFGGGLQVVLLIRNANNEPSRFNFTSCRFINNTASFGGGLSSVQVYSQGAGNIISLSDSVFEGNQASDVGGGVMFASLLYPLNRKPSHYYEVSNK